MNTYSTSEIAKILDIHPNTVMLYEKWGYMEPVKRKENGYRIFTERHLEQMKIARIALRSEFIKLYMRFEVKNIIKSAARWDLENALELSKGYLAHLQIEKKKELEVIACIEKILSGEAAAEHPVSLRSSEAAKQIGVSVNYIIYWENNGLLDVPKNKKNGYRTYTEKEIRLLKVIKALRDAHYSVSAIYRMLYQSRLGDKNSLYDAIETLDFDEKLGLAEGQLLSTLNESEKNVQELISYISGLIEKHRSKN